MSRQEDESFSVSSSSLLVFMYLTQTFSFFSTASLCLLFFISQSWKGFRHSPFHGNTDPHPYTHTFSVCLSSHDVALLQRYSLPPPPFPFFFSLSFSRVLFVPHIHTLSLSSCSSRIACCWCCSILWLRDVHSSFQRICRGVEVRLSHVFSPGTGSLQTR